MQNDANIHCVNEAGLQYIYLCCLIFSLLWFFVMDGVLLLFMYDMMLVVLFFVVFVCCCVFSRRFLGCKFHANIIFNNVMFYNET